MSASYKKSYIDVENSTKPSGESLKMDSVQSKRLASRSTELSSPGFGPEAGPDVMAVGAEGRTRRKRNSRQLDSYNPVGRSTSFERSKAK